MKKILILLPFIVSCYLSPAQGRHEIAQSIQNKKQNGFNFREVNLFRTIAYHDSIYKGIVRHPSFLKFDETIAAVLLNQKPKEVLLNIPTRNGNIRLELYQSEIFTPDFNIVTASNAVVPQQSGLHYRGIIQGDNESVCAVSIFNNEVMGMISSPVNGNMVIGKLKNSSTHILYSEKNLIGLKAADCFTADDTDNYSDDEFLLPHQNGVNCIRIYWELNYDIYLDKGSVLNATNYAVALFNQSAALYANDGIPVELSQVYVWDIPSPYTSTNSSTLLTQFQTNRNVFAGDLAHLLGYEGGGGIAASVNGLCATNVDYSQAYSGLQGSFQNVPVFSWDVEVVTHEQGHLMGSRHTHGCVWNGNNTAIDGCGPAAGFPYEGACGGAPIPAGGGTIMSYCHLVPAGINFSNGFGPQPTAVILNKYNTATCLTPCVGGTFCSATTNLIDSAVTTTTALLTWNNVGGATGYYVHYREAGTLNWTLDSTTNNYITISGLNPGVVYEWEVQTICSGGNAVWSGAATFITVPLVCNEPSNPVTTNINSLSATLNWTAVPAAIGYVVGYRPTGAGPWTTDTVASTSVQIHPLSVNTPYEWQVQTICAGGGTSSFTPPVNFTTLDAGAPVTVVLQPDGECGKDALIGSNSPSGENIRNFGDAGELNSLAWTAQGSTSNHRGLLQFDLSFIPQGSAVSNATLSLYWNTTSTNPGHSTLNGPNTSVLNKITSPWDEHLVTWMSQPPVSTVNQAIIPASTANNQNYPSIDITALVQDWVNDPATNYGMMLQLVTESYYRSLVFASSDNVDPAIRPKLEITYAPNLTGCISHQYSNCDGVDALIGNCVLAGYDTSNFGNIPEFNALSWTYSGTITDQRSLVYWDLSEIPAGANIDSASVQLFWNPNSSNTGHSTQSGTNESYFRLITSPWSENSVRWNNQPATDSATQVTVPATVTSQDDITIDVKSLVQRIVSQQAVNYGFMFGLKNESYYRSMIFCSSDHPDPAKHPRINICYSLSTGIPNANNSPDHVKILQENNSVKIFYDVPGNREKNIELFDETGKLMLKDKFNSSLYLFNIEKFAAGIYFIRITGGDIPFNRKIFIK